MRKFYNLRLASHFLHIALLVFKLRIPIKVYAMKVLSSFVIGGVIVFSQITSAATTFTVRGDNDTGYKVKVYDLDYKISTWEDVNIDDGTFNDGESGKIGDVYNMVVNSGEKVKWKVKWKCVDDNGDTLYGGFTDTSSNSSNSPREINFNDCATGDASYD